MKNYLFFFQFITLINHMNKYRNGHKSKYTKEQIIISLNNVVYENEKNMKLGSFHCHFYDRF